MGEDHIKKLVIFFFRIYENIYLTLFNKLTSTKVTEVTVYQRKEMNERKKQKRKICYKRT